MVLVAGGWWGLSWWRDGYADCVMPSRPDLVDAAIDRRSVGAAERRVVASSVLPWGASVAVTTRVWGTHSVERWVVTDRRFEKCSFAQARPVGDFFYDFNLRPGESDPTFRWFGQDEPVSADTGARWEEMFGGVTEFEIDGVDRTLAWLRVYPELLFLIPVGGLLVWSRRQTRFQG